MSADTTCSCCGLPLSNVEHIEPAFMLPDELIWPEVKDRVRCNGEFASLNGDENTPTRFFIRALFPFEVTDRDLGRRFHWGIWAELDEEDFEWLYSAEVVRRGLADPDELGLPHPKPLKPGQQFDVRIANDFALSDPIQAKTWWGTFGAEAILAIQEDPNHRPLVVMDCDDDHPLAVLQRSGVTWEKTREWVKPFHEAVMAQQKGFA